MRKLVSAVSFFGSKATVNLLTLRSTCQVCFALSHWPLAEYSICSFCLATTSATTSETDTSDECRHGTWANALMATPVTVSICSLSLFCSWMSSTAFRIACPQVAAAPISLRTLFASSLTSCRESGMT